METKQIDLTTMTEAELWKFVSEQQEQMVQIVIASNQIQQNIANAKMQIDKMKVTEDKK